ncbi:hypothetical protein MMC17_008894 [Xylographa soralifera]|nr:hypothetical protein [Xylographa soralifera]
MPLIAASLLPIRRLPTAILARRTVGERLVERSRINGIICAPADTVRKARAGRTAAPRQDLREEATRDGAVRRHVLAILLELGGRGAGAFAGYAGAIRGLEVGVVADAVEIGAVDVGVDLAVDEDVVVRITCRLAAVDLGEDCPEGEQREKKKETHPWLRQLKGDEVDQKEWLGVRN